MQLVSSKKLEREGPVYSRSYIALLMRKMGSEIRAKKKIRGDNGIPDTPSPVAGQ